MSYFFFDARVPTDTFEPRKHTQDELDAMQIPLDRRDGCKDHYAEFKKCIMVQHQTKGAFSWKSSGREHCGYYFDHWNWCREVRMAENGLQTRNMC